MSAIRNPRADYLREGITKLASAARRGEDHKIIEQICGRILMEDNRKRVEEERAAKASRRQTRQFPERSPDVEALLN